MNKPTKKIDWWIKAIPVLIILLVLLYVVLQLRIKTLGLILFYLGPFTISALSLMLLVIGLVMSFRKKPYLNTWRLVGFGVLILLLFNGSLFGKFPSYYDDRPSSVAFRVPLDEEVSVAWGGGTEAQNYHVISPEQCWAYDLVIEKNGNTFSGDGTQLTDYYCYGKMLKAPAKGEVMTAYHDDPDMPIGELGGGTTAFGNHVILKVAPNEYLYMCHFQPSSILVKEGDIVEKGQDLGLIGNSGNTSEPHLHIHLQSNLDFGEGIPMYFHNLEVDGVFTEKAIPTGGVDKDDNIIGNVIKHVSN